MGKIKGSVIVKLVQALRARKEQAREALPERLHHYLSRQILATQWFDETDYRELLVALAKLLPDVGMDTFEFMGRDAAKTDYRGIYKSFVHRGDPAATLESLQRMWRLHHDNGEIEIRFEGPRRAVVELHDYCLPSREICQSNRGYVWQILTEGGAEEISVEEEACRALGDADCRWLAEWK